MKALIASLIIGASGYGAYTFVYPEVRTYTRGEAIQECLEIWKAQQLKELGPSPIPAFTDFVMNLKMNDAVDEAHEQNGLSYTQIVRNCRSS